MLSLCLSLLFYFFSSYVFLKNLHQGYVTQGRASFFREQHAIARSGTIVWSALKQFAVRETEIMTDFKINADDADHSVIVIYLVPRAKRDVRQDLFRRSDSYEQLRSSLKGVSAN